MPDLGEEKPRLAGHGEDEMSEFQALTTKADLELLDDAEMVAGYLAGFKNYDEPGSDKSRSFWHGWRNGMVDGKHAQMDDAQWVLVRELVGKYRGLH